MRASSEVGYTSAMPRREDHEVHKDMWGIGGKIMISVVWLYEENSTLL